MSRGIVHVLFFLCFVTPIFVPITGENGGLESKTFEGLKLRNIGPALMSGRISDVAVHPQHRSTWYVAVGSGGVWKTTNAGTTWSPIFDRQISYSIGCITIDPNEPDVIWVGTGENVSGRHVGYGDGIYQSRNGGEEWTRRGLEESEHIAKILIDPRESSRIYVAAEGPLWKSGGQRGVFRTTDGGETWQPVLTFGEDTGCTDLEFDPDNPDVIYAAAYQRRRSVCCFMGGGPESGIYKSVDRGESWRRIEAGLPQNDMGKIGLAVSPIDGRYVYATIEAKGEDQGFYRSMDGGESWEKRSDYISGGTGPHYYQEVYASPHRLDRVYQMDVRIHISEDGGRNFEPLGEPYKHSDNHALVFDPLDPDYLLAGSDGGIYETWDHGKSWKFVANLPVTQFYKLALDNDLPFYNLIGGTQDNNTQLGPSRTQNVHGIRNQDWLITLGGDGHGCLIDPLDPHIIYSESQNGNPVRFDKKSGERVDIKPQPSPGDPPERWNWDTPMLISPFSNTRLYFASQRLWRSDDRGDSWTPVSGDLTRNQNRYELAIMGRVWSIDSVYDHGAMSRYNTVTSISESPLVEGLIYAGTDDGILQVTEDGGRNWRRIDHLPGVDDLFYVNEVKASVTDHDTVFVAVDNHKAGDFSPYLLRSTDRGRSWSSITGDLPDRHLIWSVVQDHEKADLLFVGTEFGIFFTLDGGGRWIQLPGGVPTISFRDLEIQRRESDLVGASFGRGFYILDDYSPLRYVSAEKLKEEAILFPVKKSLLYISKNPLGSGEKASQGAAYFTAPNPPFGAIFTYYLAQSLMTEKQKRQIIEKELRQQGENISFPGWDQLKVEDREDSPTLLLTVRDAQDQVVRRLRGPTTAGFHRVAWDLRYPSFEPVAVRSAGSNQPSAGSNGPLVTPGNYSVNLSRLINGQEVSFSSRQTFEVVSTGEYALPPQNPAEVLSFQKETWELMRRVRGAARLVSETRDRLGSIRESLLRTAADTSPLLQVCRQLQIELTDIKEQLDEDPVRAGLSESTSPGITHRLQQIVRGHWRSTYGPTQTHRRNYEIAAESFGRLERQLEKLIEEEVADLERRMEAVGAPWTPGRVVGP